MVIQKETIMKHDKLEQFNQTKNQIINRVRKWPSSFTVPKWSCPKHKREDNENMSEELELRVERLEKKARDDSKMVLKKAPDFANLYVESFSRIAALESYFFGDPLLCGTDLGARLTGMEKAYQDLCGEINALKSDYTLRDELSSPTKLHDDLRSVKDLMADLKLEREQSGKNGARLLDERNKMTQERDALKQRLESTFNQMNTLEAEDDDAIMHQFIHGLDAQAEEAGFAEGDIQEAHDVRQQPKGAGTVCNDNVDTVISSDSVVEVMEDARLYCENAGYWRGRTERAEEERDALKKKLASTELKLKHETEECWEFDAMITALKLERDAMQACVDAIRNHINSGCEESYLDMVGACAILDAQKEAR